jgi:hypothetical protein
MDEHAREPDDALVVADSGEHAEVTWPGDPDHEKRDLHDADTALAYAVTQPDHRRLFTASTFRPRSVKRIKGGVTIYDFRGTGLCPPNGGRIEPVMFVQHIPVIHNVKGIGDFITLGNVLRAQGLAVQRATDAEGGVALYTRLRDLCYHARGSNSISVGSENMHWSTTEEWTEKQMRAVAWVLAQAKAEVGIPIRPAHLVAGNGLAGCARTGYTTHMRQSQAAGYNDRTDPGTTYRAHHVRELAAFFEQHGHF